MGLLTALQMDQAHPTLAFSPPAMLFPQIWIWLTLLPPLDPAQDQFPVRIILHDPQPLDAPNPPDLFTLGAFPLNIAVSPSNILYNLCIYYFYYALCIAPTRIEVPLIYKSFIVLFK